MQRVRGKQIASALALAVSAIVIVAGSDCVQAQAGRPTPWQSAEYAIEEQPGVIPDPRDEQLTATYQRQLVFYRTSEPAGTIIVDTADRYLYLVQGNNRAIRYGIGVGREGFQWRGLLQIARKAEWPDWVPPPEMITRQPYLPRFMAGGPGNPMGARALYLGATIYRIHGTNQPKTIGSAVSSGCFRLVNGDVIDLYDRVACGNQSHRPAPAQLVAFGIWSADFLPRCSLHYQTFPFLNSESFP